MHEIETERKKRKNPIVKILLGTFLFLFLIVVFIKFFHLTDLFLKGPKTVVNLITDAGLQSDQDRTNILFLGIGGQGHDGPNLSDTMILASLDKKGKDPVLIAIPRDIWVPTLSSKINAAYSIGQDKDNAGIKVSRDTVSQLLGIPVHYVVRVDFAGFIKAVDLVGGVDLTVDRSFTDSFYPIPGKEEELCGIQIETKDNNGIKDVYYKDATGASVLLTEENNPFVCRYEVLNFKKGPNHMDGIIALKYVRSRHGSNYENSDFARSARQEKVIAAFRQKVFSGQTLLNPKKIVDLIGTFKDSIDTNINTEEIPLFIKLVQKFEKADFRKIVLDASRDESLLEVGDPSQYGGAYVLTPKTNWQDLSGLIKQQIYNPPSPIPSPSPTPSETNN